MGDVKARYLSFKPFLPWRNVERPVDWQAQFGSPAPLEVEIGFGNGEFLVRRAQERPERHFIGIELEWASVQRALRRLAQAQATNVRLLLVDAHVALQRLFSPLALQRVYSLFPCPWPKERHAKHRLFSHTFLTLPQQPPAAGWRGARRHRSRALPAMGAGTNTRKWFRGDVAGCRAEFPHQVRTQVAGRRATGILRIADCGRSCITKHR